MNYEKFKSFIEYLEEDKKRNSLLWDLKIDLTEYNELHHKNINLLLSCIFESEGLDWIDWYVYEKAGRKKFKAYDENNNEICYDIQSLWDTIKEYLKYDQQTNN